ncbi:hypothetical protein [Streptomyces sp. NPDC048361]|uniref:hypothetical protein n=1 Tax=Streptomyces sp. NPDC048361 TaxID=3154720 RepID=UPI00342CE58A
MIATAPALCRHPGGPLGPAEIAKTADTAGAADTAGPAEIAKTADTAGAADTAGSAETAKTADTAGAADTAGSAEIAKTAGAANVQPAYSDHAVVCDLLQLPSVRRELLYRQHIRRPAHGPTVCEGRRS